MKPTFDKYTIQARIQPALLTVLPLGLFVLAWLSPGDTSVSILWLVIVTGGGTTILAQISRDLGSRKQQSLFTKWGGPPSTQKLRFRGSCSNRELLGRRRQKLEALIQGPLPNEEEERRDPLKADQHYESAVAYLIEATRDHQKFPLVLEENINYGFRRNLWGLKTYGLAIASLSLLGSLALVLIQALAIDGATAWYERLFVDAEPELVERLIVAVLTTLMLAGWVLVIRPQWIKTAADSYADRLIGAIDVL